jgi:hypothetical protein
MTGICFAAGALAATLHVSQFTLAWMHSIEKIRWEEDWRVVNGKLVVDEARIVGTGAGMEPPPDAKLVAGVWHYKPAVAPLAEVDLAHSPFTKEYEVCTAGRCTSLAKLLPGLPKIAVVRMRACEQ